MWFELTLSLCKKVIGEEHANLKQNFQDLDETEKADAKEQTQNTAYLRDHVSGCNLSSLGNLCPQELLIEYIQIQESTKRNPKLNYSIKKAYLTIYWLVRFGWLDSVTFQVLFRQFSSLGFHLFSISSLRRSNETVSHSCGQSCRQSVILKRSSNFLTQSAISSIKLEKKYDKNIAIGLGIIPK